MRNFQFWILVLGSTAVSGLMVKQIFLSREFNHQQRVLIESQNTAGTARGYETAWRSLALAVYQASRTDPDLAAVLKDAKVEIRSKATGSAVQEAPSEPPMPPSPSKLPGTP